MVQSDSIKLVKVFVSSLGDVAEERRSLQND